MEPESPMVSFINNRRGMALLNMVFIFIFIGVLVVAGVKMYDSIVTRGKINDTKTAMENAVKVITAWAATNGRLPAAGDYPGVFGGTAPLDAWGRPIAYVFDGNLAATATGGLCGRTSTGLLDSGVSIAFALVSQGEDAAFQTTVGGATVPGTGANAGNLASSPLDIYRAVSLVELQSKAGCFGSTGGRLQILNNELPRVCANSPYTATVFATGGVPINGNQYKWCTVGAFPGTIQATGTGTAVAIPVCPNFSEPYPSIQLTGNAPAANMTQNITFVVQDNQSLLANTFSRTYPISVISGGACGGSPGPGPLLNPETVGLIGGNIVTNTSSIKIDGDQIDFGFNKNKGAACAWFPYNYPLYGKTLRAFWNFVFENKDTSVDSKSNADGYTFTLMQGSNPTTYCGTGTKHNDTTNPNYDCSKWDGFGEYFAYCGLPNQSMAVEFDIFPNSNRKDPGTNYNHVAIVKADSGNWFIDGKTYGDNTHGRGGNPVCDETCNGSNNGTGVAGSTACQYGNICSKNHPVTWMEDNITHAARVEIHTRCDATCNVCDTTTTTCSPMPASPGKALVKVWIDTSSSWLCTGTCDGAPISNAVCTGACSGMCNGKAMTNDTCSNKNMYIDETATPDVLHCVDLPAAMYQVKLGITEATGDKSQMGTISNLIANATGTCRTPSITPATLPSARLDDVYPATTLTASGGAPPYSAWTLQGALPPPLTFNASTQTISSGKLNSTGTYNFAISVSDGCSSDGGTGCNTIAQAQMYTINVCDALSISTSSLPDGKVGTNYTTIMASSGGIAPYTWGATDLPDGLSISSDGIISGSPTESGTFNPVITVTDACGSTVAVSKTFTLKIASVPCSTLSVKTKSLPNGRVGTAYSATLVASGSSPFAWSQTGLPSGLSLNSATGKINGTPNIFGNNTVTVTVQDSCSPTPQTRTKTLSLQIRPAVFSITNNTGTTLYSDSSCGNPIADGSSTTINYNSTGNNYWMNFLGFICLQGVSVSGSDADKADANINGQVQLGWWYQLLDY